MIDRDEKENLSGHLFGANDNRICRLDPEERSAAKHKGTKISRKGKKMKQFRKIMALAVAMVMVLSMSMSVFAADGDTPVEGGDTNSGYTITISKDGTDKAAHTYGAFQIFKGDLDEKTTGEGESATTTKTLSNIQWGDNVNSATAITELKKISAFSGLADTASAADVAKAIGDANVARDSEVAQAIADAFNKAITGDAKGTASIAATATSGTITGLVAGYYLVKDTAAVTGEGAQTRYILEVVSDVNVTEKANVPSVIKKVKDKDDNTGAETGWQDGADYDIGDSIPYKLEGTLPGKFAEYDTYKVYTFTDTLSEGLTAPKATDVKVTLDTETGDDLVAANIFEVSVSEQVITVKLKESVDLKTAKVGEKSFSATSKIIVTYNATLNEKAKIGSEGNPNTVKLDFTNNPNGEQDGEKGTTPEDKVIVFTYEIKALKVEPTSDAAIDKSAYDALTDAQKADYVKVGEKYQKTTPLGGAGFTLYKKVNGSYAAVGEEIKGVTTFEFKGTDAGEYKLVETTVPAGYNKAADVEFKVEATYDTDAADPKLKSLTVTPETAGFTVSVTETKNDADEVTEITTDGIINGKVLNQKGSTLPSTGGIGTTIFYVLGAILVLGAGIVLVTRRRMSAN